MVLIEQFYYLDEQKQQKISSLWRVIPIIFITIGSLSGLIYSTVFGSINLRFADRCIFFSKFYGKLNNTNPNNNNNETAIRRQNNPSTTIVPNFLNAYEVQWTSKATCDFMQYTPFVCSIFGIILLTLLFMCGKGGNDIRNGLNKTWRIVVPVLAATLFFSVSCLVILELFINGLQVFCDGYMKLYGGKSCSSTIDIISKAIISDYISVRTTTIKYVETDNDYYEIDNLLYYAHTNKLVSIAQLLLIIEMSAWFICVLFLTLRIIFSIDFHLIQFTIRSCEDKTVQFNKSNLETIYSANINEADDEEETETEMVTYSPTHSTVTLASPEPSDDSVELIEYNKESPEKKKKVKKVTIV